MAEEEESEFRIKEEEDKEYLTHKKAMDLVRSGVRDLLADPLLSDLHKDATLEEVNLQIALEYGQAMTVNIQRQDGETMPIVVLQGATVQDLKHAYQRYLVLWLKRQDENTAISWTYVWKTYWLSFEGEKLTVDSRKLKDYGIRNRSFVTFVKRLKQK